MANKNLKNIILTTTALTAASFAVMGIVAKKKKAGSVYDDKPEEKNPLEGKKVVFIEDEADDENADGVRGHLEAVGDSEYKGSLYDKYGKRALDVFLSGMGLIVLSPVFAGISLAIKIDDPGPVLFTQKRVGKDKQYFKLHKFRSMKMSTPHDVPTHMLENPDEYITKVGRFLRKHSLDELPQIWDIFIGNMSVIGPRPALWNQDKLTAERDKYGANDIKPGLTGWAQINGRDELEIEDKAKLDGEYVRSEGPAMDLKCFLGSLGVFGGDKSVVEGGTGELHKEQREAKIVEKPIVDIIAEKTIPVSLPDHINVLIGGKGSYIGTTVRDFLLKDPRYSVMELDMLDPAWRDFDFSSYDVVYQVAGIAHQKETIENAHLYYEVNRDLAVEVAEKAKAAGVKRFIYMSSMSVYGLEQSDELISLSTPTNPTTNYGWSKLQAEQKLRELEDENFSISFLRPPMVYGEGAPGNLEKLFKAVRKVHVFPTIRNERSSISVDNLADGVKKIIECGYCGVVILQDNKYRCTTDIVRDEMAKEGVKVKFTTAFNPVIRAMIGKVDVATKAFGDLKYEMSTDCQIKTTKTVNPKRVLMLGHLAYIIAEFNVPNIKLLREMGYEVDVACNFKPEYNELMSAEKIEWLKKTLDDMGCKYFQIDFNRNPAHIKQNIKAYEQCMELMKTRNYVFMHCHSPIGGAISRVVAHKCGVPAIYTAHGFHFYDGAPKKNWFIYYPIEKELSRWTDVLITINKEDYKRAKKEFHAKKTVYIPGVGIDTHKYGFKILTDEQIQEVRKNIGVSDDQVWLLSVGELNENKNHETVIRTIGEFSQEEKNKVFYTIAGQGDKQEELQKLIEKLGLQDNVKLLGFRDDIPNLYDAADIYVHPSFREGLSVALMEAMSSGLPVIASRIRGNVDLVDDEGGELFDPKSVEECKKAIKSLLDKTTEERASAGLYNRNKIKHFDSETVEKAIKEEYEKLDSSNIGGGNELAHLKALLEIIKLRESLGVKGSDTMMLSVGELSERKNHEVVIKALGQMKREDIKYFIAGRGDLKDHLSELIIYQDLRNNVKLLGFRSDISLLTKAADVFIFSSLQEGLPVALMEAMAAGLPIVASRIRGNVDLIQEGRNGTLFDCNSIVMCKNCIYKTVDNTTSNNRTSENNIVDVRAYNEKIVMRLLREIYSR